MIKPTIGRVVWYHPGPNDPKPEGLPPAPLNGILAAIVTYVWSDTMVNLVVFDVNGGPFGVTSIQLRQPEAPVPFANGQGPYCEWMPFQIGQAKQLEK